MSRRDLGAIAAVLLVAAAAAAGLAAALVSLCPSPTAVDPCPEAERNRLLVLALTGATAGLVVAALAFALEFAARRIAYRGAWGRALRRGGLVGLAVAAFAGLRLADALTVFSAVVVIALASAAEWVAIRRLDAP